VRKSRFSEEQIIAVLKESEADRGITLQSRRLRRVHLLEVPVDRGDQAASPVGSLRNKVLKGNPE
jgi:hypothetical protein